MTYPIQRDLPELTRHVYDLVVVGGGIYGACVAHDAALRGLSVALIDKGDWGSATSANSLKIIHGGLRYLQHFDLIRMRESIRERRALMHMAPHLVHPLPVLTPTYGYGMKSKPVMRVAMAINDLVSFDRNRLADRSKHIGRGRAIGREECLRLLPGIERKGLTGGVIFYDGRVHNSERLPLAFIRSAVAAGARVANYVRATGLLRSGNAITGVRASDALGGDTFEIRGRMVINAAGPWLERVSGLLSDDQSFPPLAKAMNLVTRQLFDDYAVGIASRKVFRDADAVINKGSRLLFVVPWRGRSMIGTSYAPYHGDPDDFAITGDDIDGLLAEINEAYPAGELSRHDVEFVHGGLLPMTSVDEQTGSVRLTKHYAIDDHRKLGVTGLLSVKGVKYTTARDVAERTVDRVVALWDRKTARSRAKETRLYGGEIANFDAFVREAEARGPFSPQTMRDLAYTYGSSYPDVLQYAENGAIDERLAVLGAQTRYAVREEAAQTLADVVFRRTELGSAGHPGHHALQHVADVMAEECGWSADRARQEIVRVRRVFRRELGEEGAHAQSMADSAV